MKFFLITIFQLLWLLFERKFAPQLPFEFFFFLLSLNFFPVHPGRVSLLDWFLWVQVSHFIEIVCFKLEVLASFELCVSDMDCELWKVFLSFWIVYKEGCVVSG